MPTLTTTWAAIPHRGQYLLPLPTDHSPTRHRRRHKQKQTLSARTANKRLQRIRPLAGADPEFKIGFLRWGKLSAAASTVSTPPPSLAPPSSAPAIVSSSSTELLIPVFGLLCPEEDAHALSLVNLCKSRTRVRRKGTVVRTQLTPRHKTFYTTAQDMVISRATDQTSLSVIKLVGANQPTRQSERAQQQWWDYRVESPTRIYLSINGVRHEEIKAWQERNCLASCVLLQVEGTMKPTHQAYQPHLHRRTCLHT